MEPTGDTRPTSPRDRLRRVVPRSTRVVALLLALGAVLASVLAFALGSSTAGTPAPLRTATPLVSRSQAVEIRGLPAARTLPTLRPPAAPAGKPATKPVEIVGEG